ncbi:Erf-like ssDNA annealing protein [Lactobacillus phage phiAQ113]|uniref:Erf-like ssDNA annealing protein n=1 Tax=Lactobacillus phage phiAQ113 TaxID=1206110 RepID=UPI00029FBAFF|nr:Erf-like ssDNA annealing protein [Lactobacillus phage phiAQ113]CCI88362.1 ERF Recombinase [Lactobacillus phage phiAQ113]
MEEIKVPILTKIQNELKAPKNHQGNSFGNYKYRTAEDIESALKPLLLKYGAQLTFDEQPIEVGGRVYIEEIAHYKDSEQTVDARGHAREDENKKGMDGSQITGSSSSYATKYALAKLFLIDDTKDADSQNSQTNQGQQSEQKTYTRNYETLNQKIENAKKYEVQYGGQKETLVSIIKLANNNNDQATKFLELWRKKAKQNEAVYQFIIKHNLAI